MKLPNQFIYNIKKLIGSEEWLKFYESLQVLPPTSIRLNPDKPFDLQSKVSPVLWAENGYYIPERPAFTFDPLFHIGAYYVQEASSMFIEQVFKQYNLTSTPINVLDLCAAPGGKSTHIASLISKESLLISNEVIKTRSNILIENIIKSGFSNTIITNNDPSEIGKIKNIFDVILIDAPCSGEGMFRKDPAAINEWSSDNVALCADRQKRIIADIWESLKPEGILIYSTCTYNKSENEDNIAWMKESLGANNLPIDIAPEWNIRPSYDNNIYGYHFFPHLTNGEGFFISVLQKKGGSRQDVQKQKSKKEKQRYQKNILTEEHLSYIINSDNYSFIERNGKWLAFHKAHESFLNSISSLRIVNIGVCLGELKGKDFIPNQSLAVSNILNKERFFKVDLDWDTAIRFLRNEILYLPNAPKGHLLVYFRGYPLGFVKNIGNRANNLYPNEWRIRTTHMPPSIPQI